MKNFLELLMVGCGADRSSYYKSHASAPTPTLRRDPRISIPYSQSSNGGLWGGQAVLRSVPCFRPFAHPTPGPSNLECRVSNVVSFSSLSGGY
jgi:hypothetical protein